MKHEPGYLDGFDISREEAESLIMQARVKAGWVTEAELNPRSGKRELGAEAVEAEAVTHAGGRAG